MREPRTEGERWTREQLEALLAARFSPRAVAGFLVASERRAVAVRRERPALGRQARAWTGAGAAAWTALALGGVEPFRRRAASGAAWWTACAVMLDWHLGMLETEDGEPRPLGPADALTLARAWLVPVAWDDPTMPVVLAAALSDAIDGPVARRAAPTRAGRDLEGLVDACFAVAALRGARRRDRLSAASARAEAARQALGFAYALAAYFGRAAPPDARLTGAARATSPVRAAGLVAAALGRRRLADALVGGGAAASAFLLLAGARA